jgi:hypothetical protein
MEQPCPSPPSPSTSQRRSTPVPGTPRGPPPDPAPPIIPDEEAQGYGNPSEPDEAPDAAAESAPSRLRLNCRGSNSFQGRVALQSHVRRSGQLRTGQVTAGRKGQEAVGVGRGRRVAGEQDFGDVPRQVGERVGVADEGELARRGHQHAALWRLVRELLEAQDNLPVVAGVGQDAAAKVPVPPREPWGPEVEAKVCGRAAILEAGDDGRKKLVDVAFDWGHGVCLSGGGRCAYQQSAGRRKR